MNTLFNQKLELLQLRNTYEEHLDFLYLYMRRGNRELNASNILQNYHLPNCDIKKEELFQSFYCVDLSPFIGFQKDFDIRCTPKSADFEFYRKAIKQLKIILDTKASDSFDGFYEGIEFYTLDTEVAVQLSELGLEVSSDYAALKNLLNYVCVLQNAEGLIKVCNSSNVKKTIERYQAIDPDIKFLKYYLVPTADKQKKELYEAYKDQGIAKDWLLINPEGAFGFIEGHYTLTEKGFTNHEDLIVFN